MIYSYRIGSPTRLKSTSNSLRSCKHISANPSLSKTFMARLLIFSTLHLISWKISSNSCQNLQRTRNSRRLHVRLRRRRQQAMFAASPVTPAEELSPLKLPTATSRCPLLANLTSRTPKMAKNVVVLVPLHLPWDLRFLDSLDLKLHVWLINRLVDRKPSRLPTRTR